MARLTKEIKEKLVQAIALTEHGISKARYELKDKLNLLEPVMIMPYHGFGAENYVYLNGRVLENEKVKDDRDTDSITTHLVNTYKRYESDEIPGIRLRAVFAGQEKELVTDEEGFFEVEFRSEEGIDYSKTANKVRLELLEQKTDEDIIEAEGVVFVPGKDVEFGIISDIDDTVLVSNMNNFMEMLRLMLTKDATERSPFPGIAGFLRALEKGSDGQGKNPLFFVSGSEWNLFDLLINFFRAHGIPEGPLLLRDKGIRYKKDASATTRKGYKQEKVRHILDTYTSLKFICIGDSGQQDPEVYQQIAKEYPGRILGIYIRDVTSDRRDAVVREIADDVQKQGTQMLLCEDTLEAARHALKMGWINDTQLADIEAECQTDEDGKKQ